MSKSQDVDKKHTKNGKDILNLQQSQPLSIKDYDWKAPRRIDSPRSLKAMELLVIDMGHITPKNIQFYQDKAATKEDLERLLKKEQRGIECFIRQIREKRVEIIKTEAFNHEMSLKHQTEKETKMKRLHQQAEEAERIRKQIEQETVQKIEKKLQKREELLKKSKEFESPHFDQFFNLKYVPKPKEYFDVTAKSQVIRQQMDLSKAKLELLKEKQLKEMGHMMEYEMNLQQIKKRNEELQKQKFDSLKHIEAYKNHRFREHMEVLTYKEQKLKEQKLLDKAIREENKERLMRIKHRETEERLMRLQQVEDKARYIKESEKNFDQNRKYMVKQMMSDFKELKKGGAQAEDIALKYAPLMKDEEALARALEDLDRRRMASRKFLPRQG